MPLTNAQYDQILRQYEERQRKRRRELDSRRERVYSRIPDYRRLEEEAASLSVTQGKKLLLGEDGALRDLHNILADLRAKRERLLLEAGFAADYLNPPYVCPDCQDTGYHDGAKCHCFRQAEISLLYEQSGIAMMLQNNNFSHLSFEYHTGEDRDHFEKAVETCNIFIKNFDSDYHNLFFYGTVGTGKSFLSGCVAKELIDTGHSVIYFSASGLFDLLSMAAFDSKNREERKNAYADLYQCDLLIIDDLGTELTNQFTASQLFSLLNERAIGKKAVIISTNLSLRELQDRYSDRIFSRITSNFMVCKLTGPDIRIYQKRQQSRK